MNGIVSPVFHAEISACAFFVGEVVAKTKVKQNMISFAFYIDDLFLTFLIILNKYVSKRKSISSSYKDNTNRK